METEIEVIEFVHFIDFLLHLPFYVYLSTTQVNYCDFDTYESVEMKLFFVYNSDYEMLNHKNFQNILDTN